MRQWKRAYWKTSGHMLMCETLMERVGKKQLEKKVKERTQYMQVSSTELAIAAIIVAYIYIQHINTPRHGQVREEPRGFSSSIYW